MQSKAKLMQAMRKARKDAGLVAVTVYVRPEIVPLIKQMATTASSPK